MNLERSLLRLLVWPTHRLAIRLSGGRLGTRRPRAQAVGTLILTTTGRRSGKPRSTPVYFTPDGQNRVIVASNAGHERDPDWWLNLQADPRARVRTAAGERPVRARQATESERARLWPELVHRYPRYEHYRRRAGREVPLVILEPDAHEAQ